MKAQIKPRINLEGRTALETVVPLATPFIVFVDPSSACNFQCTFCPTGDRPLIRSTGRYQGVLDFELYKKTIDDLQEFDDPIKVLRLYKDGEPLLNKRFPEMIAYAKKSDRVQYIDTTSNGALLTPELTHKLVESGLDRINFSIDGLSDADYLSFTKTKVNFQELVQKIKYFYDNKSQVEVCVKIPDSGLSADQRKFFFDTFGDISDRIFIENFAPCWPEFDVEAHTGVKITGGIYQNEVKDVDTCPYIFYSIAVNSDARVSLCFLDWSRRLVIGDLREQSLKDVWDSDRMFAHQIAHLRGDRKKNPTCADCGQLSHCKPDNIDPYAQELLDKLLSTRASRVQAIQQSKRIRAPQPAPVT